MTKTEITAERARAIAARFLELSAELSCDSHDWRCKVLGEFAWHSRFEIAAALEQLAELLELQEPQGCDVVCANGHPSFVNVSQVGAPCTRVMRYVDDDPSWDGTPQEHCGQPMLKPCDSSTDRRVTLAKRVRELEGAIETLVAGNVISSSRARELHGMTPEAQREHWRHCYAEAATELNEERVARIATLEGQLADARALRSGIQFRESALVERYEERGARIATLERELAAAKADAEAAKQDSDLFEPVLQRCRECFSDLPKSVQRALLYTSEQKPAVIRTPMKRREDRGRPPQASASREGAEHGE